MTGELIKKADIYANNTRFTEYDNPSLSESLDISEEIKQAYIAGAKEMQKENEQLKAQIEKMKCCGNCKLRGAECVALEYQGILCGKTRYKWELAE